jgi:hypothetical protein
MSTRELGEQIDLWERDGTIDAATAIRLRVSLSAGADSTRGASWQRDSSVMNHVVAVFLFLGGTLLLGAWELYVMQLMRPTTEMDGLDGIAILFTSLGFSLTETLVGLLPPLFIAIAGVLLMRRRGGVAGSLVGPLLLFISYVGSRLVETTAQVLTGFYSLSGDWGDQTPLMMSTIAVASSLAGLVLMLIGQRLRPGRLVTLASVVWLFGFALALFTLLQVAISGTDGGGVLNPLWTLWWLMPGLAIYLYARQARRGDAASQGRARLALVSGGLAMIGQMLVRSFDGDQSGFPVTATIALVVSGALILIAVRERESAYLWPSGVGLFGSLSVMNAIYLVGQLGALGTLLSEGILLLAIGGGLFFLRARLTVAAD